MVRPGILLIDKPGGLTSHDVVARTRRAFGTRKVGHAGTLDPMATGLLVLGIEGATRLLTYIVGADKTYTATIRLGACTTTDDAEGAELTRADADALAAVTPERIAAGIDALSGAIAQVPAQRRIQAISHKTHVRETIRPSEVIITRRPIHRPAAPRSLRELASYHACIIRADPPRPLNRPGPAAPRAGRRANSAALKFF